MRTQYYFRIYLVSLFILFILFFGSETVAQMTSEIESPGKHFGFKPGTDRMLFDYDQLISYLQKLDTSSPRLKLVEIGKSPMEKKMYIAFVSSEKNISNLESLKALNRRLALDPDIPL